MNTLIYNKDNLKDEEIAGTTTRVKCFLINDNNEILIATAGTGCQLPGGHREEGEEVKDTLIREIQEEVGIDISDEKIIPFMESKNYILNYRESGKNWISHIVYFYVKCNSEPNYTNQHLTSDEVKADYKLHRIKIDEFENFVRSFITPDQARIYVIIAEETLTAFEELNKIL